MLSGLAAKAAFSGAAFNLAPVGSSALATLIAWLSRYVTLEPGDVIATGTPAGVGHFRKPPRYLRPGDRLRLEVEKVGVLEHRMGGA